MSFHSISLSLIYPLCFPFLFLGFPLDSFSFHSLCHDVDSVHLYRMTITYVVYFHFPIFSNNFLFPLSQKISSQKWRMSFMCWIFNKIMNTLWYKIQTPHTSYVVILLIKILYKEIGITLKIVNITKLCVNGRDLMMTNNAINSKKINNNSPRSLNSDQDDWPHPWTFDQLQAELNGALLTIWIWDVHQLLTFVVFISQIVYTV